MWMMWLFLCACVAAFTILAGIVIDKLPLAEMVKRRRVGSTSNPQQDALIPSEGEVKEARNRVLIEEANTRIALHKLYQSRVDTAIKEGTLPEEVEARIKMLPSSDQREDRPASHNQKAQAGVPSEVLPALLGSQYAPMTLLKCGRCGHDNPPTRSECFFCGGRL